MPNLFEGRAQALVERLRKDALDGLLVTSLPNVRYLTGFSGTNAILLVTATQRWLFTDFRYAEQAQTEAGDAARIVVEAAS
ncbi:MAG: aminopeptidase P family N-terminal domain-containing protein, partial [Gemmatimonadaceae bacterium]